MKKQTKKKLLDLLQSDNDKTVQQSLTVLLSAEVNSFTSKQVELILSKTCLPRMCSSVLFCNFVERLLGDTTTKVRPLVINTLKERVINFTSNYVFTLLVKQDVEEAINLCFLAQNMPTVIRGIARILGDVSAETCTKLSPKIKEILLGDDISSIAKAMWIVQQNPNVVEMETVVSVLRRTNDEHVERLCCYYLADRGELNWIADAIQRGWKVTDEVLKVVKRRSRSKNTSQSVVAMQHVMC